MKKGLIILVTAILLSACNGAVPTSSVSMASSGSAASVESSVNTGSVSSRSTPVSAVSLPDTKPAEEKNPLTAVKYGNFMNYNGIFYYKGLMYYAEPNEKKLYTAKPDMSGKKVLLEPCQSIIDISDGRIFYSSGETIYNAKCNGTDIKQLTNDSSGYSEVTNGWIYYSNYDEDKRLRISKCNGSIETIGDKFTYTYPAASDSVIVKKEKDSNIYYLSDSSSKLVSVYNGEYNYSYYYNDALYVATNAGLLRIDIKTGTQSIITIEKTIGILAINKDGIFYINYKKILCRIKPGSADSIQIMNYEIETDSYFSNKSKFFHIKDGWLYYLTGGEKFIFCRVSLDGKSTQQLTDRSVGAVDFIGNRIYFTYMNYKRDMDMISMNYEKSVQSMKLDGSDKKLYYDFTGIKNVNTGFTFTDKYIIYSTTDVTPQQNMKCDLNGKSITPVSESEIPMNSESKYELITPDFRFYVKGSCIYCSNPYGSDETQISTQYGWDFMYYNGWLYFINHSGLFRARKGQNEEQLTPGLSFSDYIICGDKIVFIASGAKKAIYAINHDGTDLKSLVSEKNLHFIGVKNEWIYYIINEYITSFHTINKIKIDGTGSVTLLKTDNAVMTFPVLIDGFLYGSNNRIPGRFSRINCDTGEMQLLQKSCANRILSLGDFIYYTNDESYICRLSKKDLSVKCVLPQPVNSFTIENNQIYFVTPDIRKTEYQTCKIS